MSKQLSDNDVRAIRLSSEPGAALGKKYGVSQATISRIKRRLARAEVKDEEDLSMSGEQETEPAVEGAEIEPETPEEAPTEAEAPSGGNIKVECLAARVHLDGGTKLVKGEVGEVSSEMADLLIEKGIAKAV